MIFGDVDIFDSVRGEMKGGAKVIPGRQDRALKYRGRRLHGDARSGDERRARGVFRPSARYFIGYDGSTYLTRKFYGICNKCGLGRDFAGHSCLRSRFCAHYAFRGRRLR
jgi:hypothetical protein